VAKLMVDILGGNLTHHNESPRLSTLTEQWISKAQVS
jgi:hypothetical protein